MRPSIASGAREVPVLPAFGVGLALVTAVLIVRLAFPVNIGLVPALGVAVAYLLLPVLSPLLLVASVPMQTLGAFSIGGVGLTATKIALVASLAVLLIHLLTRPERLRGAMLLIP